MERIREHKEIHQLYSPKSRLNEFPDARWAFLIHTATNLARAFAAIHEHGHVIGDVNHGNVVVSREATVKLIDCDSFQISAEGRLFPCEVGVSTHTPPELQGLPLKDVVRTTNHDNFGLAVLIFQLLFMGRHPFSGEYGGSGEMSLERAIREFRFAYGKDRQARQMKQPPGTLPLDAMPDAVSGLFDRAFLAEFDRPGPAEWTAALGELAQNLRQCFYNKSHSFYKNLQTCPWCNVEVKSHALLFNAPWNSALSGSSYNLPAIWKKIENMELAEPRNLPTEPSLSSLMTTSDEAVRNWRRKLYTLVSASAGMIVISSVVAFTNTPIDISLAIVILCGTLGIMFMHKTTGDLMVQLVDARAEAESRWRELKEKWFCEEERSKFKETQEWLRAKKTQYQSLDKVRLEKIAKLESDLRREQLNRYLAGFPISESEIPDVEQQNKEVLGNHGIVSAVDVKRDVLMALGGIGRHTAYQLLDWRQSLEKHFVYDLSNETAGFALQKIDKEVASTKLNLERDLNEGQTILGKIANEVRSTPGTLAMEVEEVLLRLAQLDADSRVGAESHAPMGLLIIAIIISLIIVVASK